MSREWSRNQFHTSERAGSPCRRRSPEGFTLVEVVLGSLILSIALAAILGASIGQITVNEHARNLSLAMHDANRVFEQLRQQNTGAGCASPTALPPSGANWNAWLELQNPGKSLPGPSVAVRNAQERIVVTCQNSGATQYCPAAQATEWHAAGPAGAQDPLRVTVAVCWRHRNRTVGECSWNGNALTEADGGNGPNATAGVIESPAMLTTLVTCR